MGPGLREFADLDCGGKTPREMYSHFFRPVRVLNGRPRTGSDWLDQVQVESSLIVEIRLTDQS